MSAMDAWGAGKIGNTNSLSYTGTTSRTEMVTNTPASTQPRVIVLMATTDVYIRQGGSTVNATTSDFLLRANTYWPVVVQGANDAYIAALRVDTNGTLRITDTSRS